MPKGDEEMSAGRFGPTVTPVTPDATVPAPRKGVRWVTVVLALIVFFGIGLYAAYLLTRPSKSGDGVGAQALAAITSTTTLTPTETTTGTPTATLIALATGGPTALPNSVFPGGMFPSGYDFSSRKTYTLGEASLLREVFNGRSFPNDPAGCVLAMRDHIAQVVGATPPLLGLNPTESGISPETSFSINGETLTVSDSRSFCFQSAVGDVCTYKVPVAKGTELAQDACYDGVIKALAQSPYRRDDFAFVLVWEQAGERIYVFILQICGNFMVVEQEMPTPYPPTATLPPTGTPKPPTNTPVVTRTFTPTSEVPTKTGTPGSTATFTVTAIGTIPTSTKTSTSTRTFTPTVTPEVPTVTRTVTLGPTATPTETSTRVPTFTRTPTATVEQTATRTSTVAKTPTATKSPTTEPSPTKTRTFTPTSEVPTCTDTPRPTKTWTPSPVPPTPTCVPPCDQGITPAVTPTEFPTIKPTATVYVR